MEKSGSLCKIIVCKTILLYTKIIPFMGTIINWFFHWVCPYKKECIKGNHSKKPLEEREKTLYVSKKFIKYREEDLERIQSLEGCELRMNRSIQSEGSFGELKQNSGFRRFLCRGRQNVKAESILLAFSHNMNKLYHKIQAERTGPHLFSLKKKSA